MLDIPSKCIVSSRLSNLDTEGIRRVIHQAQTLVPESSFQKHFRNNPNTSLLAVGISNPEELRLVIDRDIPIIHIQKNCQALQAAQKHYWGTRFYTRKLLKLVVSGLWAIFGTGVSKIRFKRGQDNVDVPVLNGSIPLPNLLLVGSMSCVGFLLCLVTKRLIKSNRRDYHVMDQEEFILIQDNVRRGSIKFTIQSILPYTVIGLGLYFRKR
ncbi:hypothetical protein K501DRAFT_259195 [Backusella circina FSU 941]|nr:hypothetical protein K501DRAFT_259195 [Backusella circina FSU 941]